MRFWGTEIRAIDPMDGEMKTWGGPVVPGITYKDAKRYCRDNGLGYCKVIKDMLVASITNGRKISYTECES